MLEALERSRLIEPKLDAEGFGCGFERCGRTDAGVSSSAQVINLWVRSDLDDPMGDQAGGNSIGDCAVIEPNLTRSRSSSAASDTTSSSSLATSLTTSQKPATYVEIPYVNLLNRHLPPSVRVLAWSPVSREFSSRHSCIWRHYKYFFSTSGTQPLLRSRFDFGTAYPAAPDRLAWQRKLESLDMDYLELNVDLMRQAVAMLVGEHDFRNLCRLDPAKQLATHRRSVLSATIDPVEGEEPDMFVLNLRGNAFVSALQSFQACCLLKTKSLSIIAALQPGSTYHRTAVPCRRAS